MIDLRERTLPNTVNVGGKVFFIKTDFREWLKYSEMRKDARTMGEYFYLFVGEVPNESFIDELNTFFINANSSPVTKKDNDGVAVLDYLIDGEYIVGAFLQAYGIDLVDIEYLHWQKFQALLRSLPSDTKLSEIMGYRAYKKSSKTQEQAYQHARDLWSLPDLYQEKANEELLEIFNSL